MSSLATGSIAVAACLVPLACSTPAPSQFSVAFIGDVPYGTEAIGLFPSLVREIDADPDVVIVAHAGDVRGGDTDCSDATLRATFDLYQGFDDAFWYTPGDNEWTDCHRAGGFLPTERLAFIRALFFPVATQTTGGAPIQVKTQASSSIPAEQPYVENTVFQRDCVTFGAVHVVGSNDDAEPWGSYPGDPTLGLSAGDQPELRVAEVEQRRAAALAWIDRIFDEAALDESEAVFVMMQAEPFDDANYGAVRARLVDRATAFGKPVILGHGDSHVYQNTPGYAGVPNLTRIEVAGEEAAESQWVKITAQCDQNSLAVFTVEQKTFTPAVL
jgi:hypothetical protein